jgi:hypothetical protein
LSVVSTPRKHAAVHAPRISRFSVFVTPNSPRPDCCAVSGPRQLLLNKTTGANFVSCCGKCCVGLGGDLHQAGEKHNRLRRARSAGRPQYPRIR